MDKLSIKRNYTRLIIQTTLLSDQLINVEEIQAPITNRDMEGIEIEDINAELNAINQAHEAPDQID